MSSQREQQEKRRCEKLQGTGTDWQYHEKELKVDLVCVCQQLDSRKKYSNSSPKLMIFLIRHSFVLVKKQTFQIMWFEGCNT